MKRKRQREYDEREVSLLLDRAAQIQPTEALVPVTGGRTLDELKAIAAEAGMDAAALEAAAQELDRTNTARLPVIGRSPRMELTTTIEGVLDEDDRRELLGILQRELDAKGRVRDVGRGFEWRRFGLVGRELVVVSTHKGKTRIEVRGRYRRGMVLSFFGGGMLAGMSTMGLLDILRLLNPLDILALPIVLAAALYAGRSVWSWWSGIKEQMLRKLSDRLGDFTEESASAPPPALPPRSSPGED